MKTPSTRYKDERPEPAPIPLTTGIRIQPTSVDPISLGPIRATASPVAATPVGQVTNEIAGDGGNIPLSPPLLPLSDDFQPAAGVYLIPAPTGRGKTIICTSLVMWANAVGVPATYYYMFEARAKPILVGEKPYFQQPSNFIYPAGTGDLSKVIKHNQTPKLIICDSVTMPMKAFAKWWPEQATFTGGAQPSDYGFLNALAALAERTASCIMITINQGQIPYAQMLAGATEGLISLTDDISTIIVADRTSTSARRNITISIPVEFTQMALTAWRLGDLEKRHQRTNQTVSPYLNFLGV
jgi:hypothetical protein